MARNGDTGHAEEPSGRREIQADHRVSTAFDVVDESPTTALDGVRARLVHRFAGGDVGVDLGAAQRAEGDLGGGQGATGLREVAITGAGYHGLGCQNLVCAVGQQGQRRRSVGRTARLSQNPVPQHHNGVGAQGHLAGLDRGARFECGQPGHVAARTLVRVPGLVDVGWPHHGMQPQRGQQLEPSG